MARRVLPLLPSMLLIAVAIHQIALTRAHALNPWKGGGFGMFATIDHASARRVRIFHEIRGSDVAWAIPPELEAASRKALQLPSPANLRRLASDAWQRWPDDGIHPPDAIRVEVWRTELDLENGALRRERLRMFRAPRPPS